MNGGHQLHQRVRNELACLQQARDVRVLVACESVSRAWGFASRDGGRISWTCSVASIPSW